MYAPQETASSERLTDHYGEYFLARLNADTAAAGAAKGFQAAQTGLRQANQTEREAFRRESSLTAVRDHADFKLDETVRQFELALLGNVSKNRQAKEYKAFFPDGLTAVIAAPIKDEINAVKLIEAQLASGNPDLKQRFLSALAAARTVLETAHASLEEASNGHALAMTREMTARRDWIRSYRATYGGLIALFPDDKRRVESYWRARAGNDRTEQDDAATPETSRA